MSLLHYYFYLNGQSGGASQWRVCYQRGQLRLVITRWSLIGGQGFNLFFVRDHLLLDGEDRTGRGPHFLHRHGVLKFATPLPRKY